MPPFGPILVYVHVDWGHSDVVRGFFFTEWKQAMSDILLTPERWREEEGEESKGEKRRGKELEGEGLRGEGKRREKGRGHKGRGEERRDLIQRSVSK